MVLSSSPKRKSCFSRILTSSSKARSLDTLSTAVSTHKGISKILYSSKSNSMPLNIGMSTPAILPSSISRDFTFTSLSKPTSSPKHQPMKTLLFKLVSCRFLIFNFKLYLSHNKLKLLFLSIRVGRNRVYRFSSSFLFLEFIFSQFDISHILFLFLRPELIKKLSSHTCFFRFKTSCKYFPALIKSFFKWNIYC